MSEKRAPFKTLGSHLKYLRENSNETLAEVSGAVEIDESVLWEIEEGHTRPAEEILLLLISHFSMNPGEAMQVWDLAGYDGEPDLVRNEIVSSDMNKNVMMIMAVDPRTVYTDGVDVVSNEAGITISFTQEGKDQPAIVSKVGMSHDQAQKVYEALQATLLRAKYLKGPKELPENTQNT
jgi:hypothetical protein